MKRKSISQVLMAAAPIVMVCGLLVSGVSAVAQSDHDRPCSNRTLLGDYGFAIDGVILAIPGVTLPPGGVPFRGVTMTHFDGNGNLTQLDHDVFNGAPQSTDWAPVSGTYTINPDCTGTMVLIVTGNPLSPVNLHLVVVRRGREIHTVVDVNAVTSVGIKVD